MKTIRLAIISLGFVVFIAGCGGGGGGGGGSAGGTNIPTAAVQITQANAKVVAAGAMTPSQSMVTTGSGQAGVVGVVVQASGHTRSVLDISLAEFNRARSLKFSPVAAGAIQSQSFQCTTSGNFVISANDANNDQVLNAGDSFSITFNNCVLPTTTVNGVTVNGSTTNGSLTFAITALSGTLAGTGTPQTPLTAAFTLTFNNFTSTDNVTSRTESIHGDISFSTLDNGTNTTGTMLGASLRMDSSVDGAFLLTNYNFSFTEANFVTTTSPYSFSVGMTIASTIANGSVTITTPLPFTGVGIANPTAGVMVITGANNSTLTLTANADGIHVGIVVDEDGPGPLLPVTITNPATPGIDYTWADV